MQYIYEIRLDNDVQRGAWTDESARGDKRHFSVSHSVRYALLFFERDTKSLSH
ncbi:hypothetical protein CC460_003001 [Salmonella enterica subsp. enterica serovar Paratyphi C]|nr:hypothetical protein [Salmonella enterica subsp. enterica serovar Paratyphi C]